MTAPDLIRRLEVFEVHGVAVRRRGHGAGNQVNNIIAREGPRDIVLEVRFSETPLTPEEARRLARSLYRCARSTAALVAWTSAPTRRSPAMKVDYAELKRLAEKARKRAPGLWGSDIEKTDGEYGGGDETREGFMVPFMETEHGKRLFDAHYCDVTEVQEDYDSDDEGVCTIYAWDQASKEIFDFIAAVQPTRAAAIISDREADQARIAELEAENARLRNISIAAEGRAEDYRTVAINQGWNWRLCDTYGREAYAKQRGEHVDACALNAAESRARAALATHQQSEAG